MVNLKEELAGCEGGFVTGFRAFAGEMSELDRDLGSVTRDLETRLEGYRGGCDETRRQCREIETQGGERLRTLEEERTGAERRFEEAFADREAKLPEPPRMDPDLEERMEQERERHAA